MTGEERVVRILRKEGPLNGARLTEDSGLEAFTLWKTCRKLSAVRFEAAGRRFLRLDRAVKGFARLSPSIRREFLTYTVLGLAEQVADVKAAAAELTEKIRGISRTKRVLARESMASAAGSLEEQEAILEKTCFLIAGDVVYDMSHTVPRPEKSTGEMVRGSDLDIIVITEDGLPERLFQALDKAIYKRKHFLLVHPDYREEIDYILKGLSRVRDQMRFDSFESMVACKILREGEFLCGSESLFTQVKSLLEEYEIPRKLDEMERHAIAGRAAAEQHLLDLPADSIDSESIHLFYTREESEEIY